MTFQAIWYMVGSESPRKNGHWIQHKQADALAAFYLLDYFRLWHWNSQGDKKLPKHKQADALAAFYLLDYFSAIIWIYRMKIFLHPSVLLVVMKVWVPRCFRYSPKSVQCSLSVMSLEPKFHELSAFCNLFCWILSGIRLQSHSGRPGSRRWNVVLFDLSWGLTVFATLCTLGLFT